MKKCEFQQGPTCQIFALKNAVELELKKHLLIFSKRDKYKFKKLEQLIIEADKCQSLNRSSYFYYECETKNLPTYVAIFARAFPKFVKGETEIKFNYKMFLSDELDGTKNHWFDIVSSGTGTFVLVVNNIMLGYIKEMLLPHGKEIAFGTSVHIDGIKRPFMALREIATQSTFHAVAIEDMILFGNQEMDYVNASETELLWYYDLLRVSLLAKSLSKDKRTSWQLEADSVFKVLCTKFNMSEDDSKFRFENLSNEVLLTKMSLLNLLQDNDLYGYFNILDSNSTLHRVGKTGTCRWILPFSQIDYVLGHMIQITPIENDDFDDDPFVYESGHFQDKNGLDTVLDAEKSIYGRDKILTEQEIDEILSEGYI